MRLTHHVGVLAVLAALAVPAAPANAGQDPRRAQVATQYGYDEGYRQGLRVGELAASLVADFGVWNALNLDGGGSTSFALADSTGVVSLLNSSSDNPAGRVVATSLAIVVPPRTLPFSR